MDNSENMPVQLKLNDNCHDTFSNWIQFKPKLDNVFASGKGIEYLKYEFTRPLTEFEKAVVEGCPVDKNDDNESEHKIILSRCDDGLVYFVKDKALTTVGEGLYEVEVEGIETYELDPGETSDCVRYYDVKVTWPIRFKMDHVTKEYMIVEVRDPHFEWETSEAY